MVSRRASALALACSARSATRTAAGTRRNVPHEVLHGHLESAHADADADEYAERGRIETAEREAKLGPMYWDYEPTDLAGMRALSRVLKEWQKQREKDLGLRDADE